LTFDYQAFFRFFAARAGPAGGGVKVDGGMKFIAQGLWRVKEPGHFGPKTQEKQRIQGNPAR
jgi:hypothetical protein